MKQENRAEDRRTRPHVGALIYAVALSLTLTIGSIPAFGSVVISINKNTQQMSVSVNGQPRYQFAVSTGRSGYGTPSGTFRPERMARSWFSKRYYNSPMPHSIFFYHGYAIHGSYEIRRLGGPASHGCVRLHPSNARALFALVQREGTSATTIVVHGSNPMGVQEPIQRNNEMPWDSRPQPGPWPAPFFGPHVH